jgi:hypothetical protein
MMAQTLESIARDLGTGSTRRRFVRLLGGLTAMGMGAGISKDDGAEAKRRRKKKHQKRQKRPAATCSDGIQNGTESDIDCGGSCPRCATGRACRTRTDCASALCSGTGQCIACVDNRDCGGSCFCTGTATGGSACAANVFTGPFSRCEVCPAGTLCLATGPNEVFCYDYCDA